MFKQKVLFLEYSDQDFFAKKIRERDIHVGSYIRNYHKTGKLFRVLPILVIQPLISFFFDDWKKQIHEYDVLILPASYYAPKIIRYVKKKKKDIRIIVWYWNSVIFDFDPIHFRQLDCELWSFDRVDCEKYGLKYNSQYYFNDIKLETTDAKIDVLFIGRDKGRLAKLLDLEKALNEQGLSTYFHITETIKKDHIRAYKFKKEIEYTETLKMIQNSKSILDFTQDFQTGLTLRPLEAVYFGKKLITNNKGIFKHDIYDSNNMFVLDHNDIDHIVEFVNQPFKNVSHEVLDYYDFSSWIKRFGIR